MSQFLNGLRANNENSDPMRSPLLILKSRGEASPASEIVDVCGRSCFVVDFSCGCIVVIVAPGAKEYLNGSSGFSLGPPRSTL